MVMYSDSAINGLHVYNLKALSVKVEKTSNAAYTQMKTNQAGEVEERMASVSYVLGPNTAKHLNIYSFDNAVLLPGSINECVKPFRAKALCPRM